MENLPKSVQIVLRRLEEDGREAWCVGGCVRDSLLGRTPEDWDVTTSALPEQIMELFGTQARPTGLQHGTVSVTLEGETVEVTTFRVDGTYHDHRRPDQVAFTRSLEEDLRRRDFTINAMALNLRGELRDPFCGQSDLTAGVLRCVGEPERRFEEDALRDAVCVGSGTAGGRSHRRGDSPLCTASGADCAGADCKGADGASGRGPGRCRAAGVSGCNRCLLAGDFAHGGL